nr:protein Simiate-like isoform X1 [Physcomitrium patens]|eukprot:XP_024357044.1 protein Simiate-like isoform X1 [Physcomitrella patens]
MKGEEPVAADDGVESNKQEVSGVGGDSAVGSEGVSLPLTVDVMEGKSGVESGWFPRANELPLRPPRAIESNFTHWVALDVGKEFHDQYIYRHGNGLCVIGLLPTHAAFKPTPAVTAVDFNVGKQNRADAKVSGKRKRNAILLHPDSVLCKVMVGEVFYLISQLIESRCCVRGVMLEVNERLIKEPTLLNTRADTEGHIGIMMPSSEDWSRACKTFLTMDQYKARRGIV